MANRTALIEYALQKAMEDCTVPKFFEEALPIAGTWTFHKIITVVAGIATIITLILSFGLAISHLLHFSRPAEQRQIVRVVLTTAIFAIFNFFAVWFYGATSYLEPVADLYECFSLVAIFLLFLAFLSPDKAQHNDYFANVDRQTRGGNKKHNRGSLKWFYFTWVEVFQILPVRLACTVATWTLTANGCPLSASLQYKLIGVEVVQSLFTTICVMAIIQFYRRFKDQLKRRSALSKLVVFKSLVFLQIIQGPLFEGLVKAGVMKATETVSQDDMSKGIPALVTCIESFIFAIAFLWPFAPTQYRAIKLGMKDSETMLPCTNEHSLGFGSALLHTLNIWDIIRGCWFHNKVFALFKQTPTPAGLAVLKESDSLDRESSPDSTRKPEQTSHY